MKNQDWEFYSPLYRTVVSGLVKFANGLKMVDGGGADFLAVKTVSPAGGETPAGKSASRCPGPVVASAPRTSWAAGAYHDARFG